jgi:hypothetical protein
LSPESRRLNKRPPSDLVADRWPPTWDLLLDHVGAKLDAPFNRTKDGRRELRGWVHSLVLRPGEPQSALLLNRGLPLAEPFLEGRREKRQNQVVLSIGERGVCSPIVPDLVFGRLALL